MKFSIVVPATSANMGPGFDTAGIALSLYNTFTFELKTSGGITFHDSDHDFNESLTLNTYFQVLKEFKVNPPQHIHLETKSNIPVARGLGSSSTCIVAGIMAANKTASLNLTKHEMAQIASRIEGHPDNVTPAIMGNMCLCVYDSESFLVQNLTVHPSLQFVGVYPDKPVSTQKARAILPTTLPYEAIVYSLSRASLLAYGFQSGDVFVLAQITKDKLHEPYRSTLIEDYALIIDTFTSLECITSWISGSGPTMIALVQNPDEALNTLASNLSSTYSIHHLTVDTAGARYI
ncbi:hypothetical protein AOC36_04460 [Erysipelothrix larvae]|uniref:Homoserine kinase n=1 Tax=Erysipelothrix larvae TaxID=1514105 RepID=A0A0X8GZE1_9FIRM|nr:homoserine kinase [Erysipelothrix larvae]AMC93249.1 hypothetical protein AOC36_04460 [Erysipelothrix larvae]